MFFYITAREGNFSLSTCFRVVRVVILITIHTHNTSTRPKVGVYPSSQELLILTYNNKKVGVLVKCGHRL